MSRDKQISEMANIIALKAFEQAHLIDGDENLADIVAEDLYEKGFRKQSDVAREIFEEIEKLTASVYNDFMFNREGVGMQVTKVVEFSDELDIALAELKKKYESENDNG